MTTIKQITLVLFICIFAGNCTAGNEPETRCGNWIVTAVKAVESVPTKDRFKLALTRLQSACSEDIPLKLKQAAKQSLAAASVNQRQAILQQAAVPYFSTSCLDTGPGQPAKNLLHICLGEDFINGPYTSILPNIDAASYMYGKAIEKELHKAGLDKFYTRKFLLNYFLGAALEFEARK